MPLVPVLKAAYDKIIGASLPSKEMRDYFNGLNSVTAISTAMSVYKQSWSQDINRMMTASTQAYGEMRDLIDGYPIDSSMRSEMASKLNNYYASVARGNPQNPAK